MKTKSLCPVCLKAIEAEIVKRNGRMIMEKNCREHGSFRDVYWSDAVLYERFKKFAFDGKGVTNPNSAQNKSCPFDCGLCANHKTSTILANIDLTNRCNQNCPVCFANAAAAKYIYEPSIKQVEKMLELLANEKPIRTWSVQFSGGEPMIHPDFLKIVKMAKKMKFTQVQVATNGVVLANDPDFASKLREAGIDNVYLQFDGFKRQTYARIRGYNALPVKMRTIENCRKAGLKAVVLVPTVIKGINDGELGEIIRFMVKNKDVVRGVNFQPVSFAGRISAKELEKKRVTIPDVLKLVENQTQGQISMTDFYPVPSVVPFSKYAESWLNKPQVELTVHPHCGAGTYIFADRGKIYSIARFFDIEKFLKLVKAEAAANKGKKLTGAKKVRFAIDLMKNTPSLFKGDARKKSEISSVIIKTFIDIVKRGDRNALLEFHNHFLFVGVMHFQDAYNIDMERVKRCGIHYTTPDGRIIPFCTYNTLYREEIERKFAKYSQDCV